MLGIAPALAHANRSGQPTGTENDGADRPPGPVSYPITTGIFCSFHEGYGVVPCFHPALNPDRGGVAPIQAGCVIFDEGETCGVKGERLRMEHLDASTCDR